MWTVKVGSSITINWRDYLYNGVGDWYHSTYQDWNDGVDPGVISYTYDNSANTYTVTGLKAGISIIRVVGDNGQSARLIVIVEE